MSRISRYSETFPGDDITGPFTVCLVVGKENEPETFTSIVQADDLLGVRQFLYEALSSVSLYEQFAAQPISPIEEEE